jgi:hypothetical protein
VIHNTLNRLEKQGEVTRFDLPSGTVYAGLKEKPPDVPPNFIPPNTPAENWLNWKKKGEMEPPPEPPAERKPGEAPRPPNWNNGLPAARRPDHPLREALIGKKSGMPAPPKFEDK